MMEPALEVPVPIYATTPRKIMKSANKSDRERVRDQVLDARTLPEVALARQEICDWIRRNPDDTGIQEVFGGLSLMEDIAKEQEAERLLSNRKPVASR
ncbi:MAG: hypothetical protein ACRYFS_09810 [Janthinobacterium lividum]